MIAITTHVEAKRGRGHILVEPTPHETHPFRITVSSLCFQRGDTYIGSNLTPPRASGNNRLIALQRMPAAVATVLARCQRIVIENEFTEEEWARFQTLRATFDARTNSIRLWLRRRGHRHSPPKATRLSS